MREGELNRRNTTLNLARTAVPSVKPVSRCLRSAPVSSGVCTQGCTSHCSANPARHPGRTHRNPRLSSGRFPGIASSSPACWRPAASARSACHFACSRSEHPQQILDRRQSGRTSFSRWARTLRTPRGRGCSRGRCRARGPSRRPSRSPSGRVPGPETLCPFQEHVGVDEPVGQERQRTPCPSSFGRPVSKSPGRA